MILNAILGKVAPLYGLGLMSWSQIKQLLKMGPLEIDSAASSFPYQTVLHNASIFPERETA